MCVSLNQHSHIYVSGNHHIAEHLLDRDDWRQGQAMSLSLVLDARPDEAIAEASVFCLYSRDAAVNIQSSIPGAQAIVMPRNPVDVMYSMFSRLLISWWG
jgi:hypothetical protein